MDDRLNCSQAEALPEIGSIVPAGPCHGMPWVSGRLFKSRGHWAVKAPRINTDEGES